jgi:hypothetical protein
LLDWLLQGRLQHGIGEVGEVKLITGHRVDSGCRARSNGETNAWLVLLGWLQTLVSICLEATVGCRKYYAVESILDLLIYRRLADDLHGSHDSARGWVTAHCPDRHHGVPSPSDSMTNCSTCSPK